MRFMKKEGQSNCVGFTLYALGLQKTDKFVDSATYNLTKDFTVTEQGEEAIGAIVPISGGDPLVCHLAIVDPLDRRFVLHRPETGKRVGRETREKAFEEYQSVGCLLVNLKSKKQTKRRFF